MYSYLSHDNEKNKKRRRYKTVWHKNKWEKFRREKNNVHTEEINKISLIPIDEKTIK